MKTYRVSIDDTSVFTLDVIAENEEQAMTIARAKLDAGADPIEDSSAYEGYQVREASEIPEEDAELDEDEDAKRTTGATIV